MKFLKLKQSGLLFVPSEWQKAIFIRWLKRIHAWTGLWGAVLFLMLGVSGLLLNHRDILEIDTGEPQVVSAMNIAVDPKVITSEKGLGAWVVQEFGLISKPRFPRHEKGVQADHGLRSFLGKDHVEPVSYKVSFNHPDGRLHAEYLPGAATVAVRQDAHNLFGVIKNLHKGSGVGVGWVLFMDSIAGALTAMSLTGFLLWSRMHGSRILAGGIVVASLALATFAIWPYLL